MANSINPDHVYPLVLLGGGHSHALWLKYWQRLDILNPLKAIRPLLISENPNSPYSGMLPGLLSGDYTYDDCHIDLVHLCQNSHCDFLQGNCISIKRIEHSEFETLYRLDFKPSEANATAFIYCEKLSINIGSQPVSLTSNSDSSHPDKTSWKVKPISQFYNNWQRLQEALNTAKAEGPIDKPLEKPLEKPTISIIGAGAAGVEIACAIKLAQENCHVQLISRSKQPLPSFSVKLQQRCLLRLQQLGIQFIGEHTSIESSSDFTILCTQSAAPQWLKDCDLSLSETGFIGVDENLQASLPGVFAAGDCAHFIPQPLPKAGVFAVRQADTLFQNICLQLSPDSSTMNLIPFKPQANFLSIINMGNHYALAQKGRWSLSGFLPWRYKHYIDEKFMAQFK
jgi:selenide,water dikinase